MNSKKTEKRTRISPQCKTVHYYSVQYSINIGFITVLFCFHQKEQSKRRKNHNNEKGSSGQIFAIQTSSVQKTYKSNGKQCMSRAEAIGRWLQSIELEGKSRLLLLGTTISSLKINTGQHSTFFNNTALSFSEDACFEKRNSGKLNTFKTCCLPFKEHRVRSSHLEAIECFVFKNILDAGVFMVSRYTGTI